MSSSWHKSPDGQTFDAITRAEMADITAMLCAVKVEIGSPKIVHNINPKFARPVAALGAQP
jgi:hypothetical protein